MYAIKEWLISICYTLIICQIFLAIAPKGSLGKIFKYVIGIFLILALAHPLRLLGKSSINFRAIDGEPSNFEEAKEKAQKEIEIVGKNYVYKIGADNINILVKASMDDLEIKNFVSQTKINSSNNSSIGNDFELEIIIPKSEAKNEEKIREKIKNEVGIIPSISYREEELK